MASIDFVHAHGPDGACEFMVNGRTAHEEATSTALTFGQGQSPDFNIARDFRDILRAARAE
jgi:hypothetical protein